MVNRWITKPGSSGGGGEPDAHAVSHENGGGDEVNVTGLSGLLADGQTALAHSTSHQNGGSDEVSVAGLSGLLADGQTPLAHKTSHQDGGGDEIDVAGLSGLLADGQTPLAHATSHRAGGSDLIQLDDFATPDDNTDLNVSTARHGLMSKLPGGTATFYRADGTFTTPAGGAPVLSMVEKDLGTACYSGVFDITGLAGLTPGNPVYIQQAVGPYTGKGDRQDEAEMDQATITGFVVDSATIRAYWVCSPKGGPLAGNVRFQYMVGG